jgi:hypothetical protein
MRWHVCLSGWPSIGNMRQVRFCWDDGSPPLTHGCSHKLNVVVVGIIWTSCGHGTSWVGCRKNAWMSYVCCVIVVGFGLGLSNSEHNNFNPCCLFSRGVHRSLSSRGTSRHYGNHTMPTVAYGRCSHSQMHACMTGWSWYLG